MANSNNSYDEYETTIEAKEKYIWIANILIIITMLMSLLTDRINLIDAIIISILIWLIIGGQIARFVLIMKQRKANYNKSKP